MGVGAWIFAGGAALVGVLYVRARAKPAPPKSGGGSPCDALSGELKTACEALDTGLNLLGDAIDAIDDSKINIGLNGAVKKQIPAAFLKVHPEFIGGAPGSTWMATDLEYANGCVPYPGHPNWSKCATGTHSLANDLYEDDGLFGADARAADCSRIGTGATKGDPLTYKVDDPSTIPGDLLPKQPGAGYELWWVAGVLQWSAPCAAGTARVASDDRTGGGTVDKPVLAVCFADAATLDRNGKQLAGSAPTQGCFDAEGALVSCASLNQGGGRDHRTTTNQDPTR